MCMVAALVCCLASTLAVWGQPSPAVPPSARPLPRGHEMPAVDAVIRQAIAEGIPGAVLIVGHDGQSDLAEQNGEASHEHKHEAELKLILSSNLKTWNISENFIAEKNLGHEPWEFGYAIGATRPLRGAASDRPCWFCADKFIAGVEAYGGLGDTAALTLRDTSHYVAPLIGWQLPRGMRLSFSPGFGLTSSSLDRVFRVGLAFELNQVSSWFHVEKGVAP